MTTEKAKRNPIQATRTTKRRQCNQKQRGKSCNRSSAKLLPYTRPRARVDGTSTTHGASCPIPREREPTTTLGRRGGGPPKERPAKSKTNNTESQPWIKRPLFVSGPPPANNGSSAPRTRPNKPKTQHCTPSVRMVTLRPYRTWPSYVCLAKGLARVSLFLSPFANIPRCQQPFLSPSPSLSVCLANSRQASCRRRGRDPAHPDTGSLRPNVNDGRDMSPKGQSASLSGPSSSFVTVTAADLLRVDGVGLNSRGWM